MLGPTLDLSMVCTLHCAIIIRLIHNNELCIQWQQEHGGLRHCNIQKALFYICSIGLTNYNVALFIIKPTTIEIAIRLNDLATM